MNGKGQGDNVADLSLGEKGLKLLQDFEQFRTKMYESDGGGHCTVGWGHLVHRGKCDGRENEKQFTLGITKDDGNKLLASDTADAEKAVNKAITDYGVSPTQNQFDALVSFAYNAGTGSLKTMLKGAEKEGKLDLKNVPDRMKLYEKSDGQIVKGLTNRRSAEISLFKTP
jgi:GH24 family phage-related lysozyme (muramidase)